MQPIIVGIDPGTTSAFAVLSFDFKVLKVKSKKEYSLGGLIADIYKEGNPILVGTDKQEIPSFIKEFSQKTGAKIYSPKYDTKKGEKLHIVKEKGFSDIVNNAHETDALASAIFAYNEYLSLIKKIKIFCEENNKQEIKDKIFIKVICENMSISKAVSEIEKKPVKKIFQELRPILLQKEKILTKEQKEIELLKNSIANLKYESRILNQENNTLKQKKVDISKETKKLISFKESRALMLDKENKLLKEELSKKEKVIQKLEYLIALSKNSVLLKRLKNLGSEEFEKKQPLLIIEKDDILIVEDISVISDNVIEKIKEKVKVIIYDTGKLNPLQDDFIMLEKKRFHLLETKYFSLAEKNEFEKELDNDMKTRKKDKTFIKNIIEEYRRERGSDNIE